MSIETYGKLRPIVETCTCKALMRPRWSRDNLPRVFVCQRCGKCVPGYEELWLIREKAKNLAEKEGKWW